MDGEIQVKLPYMDEEAAKAFISFADYGLSFLNYMELNKEKFSEVFPLMNKMTVSAKSLGMDKEELKTEFDIHNQKALLAISFIMKLILDEVAAKYGISYEANFDIEDRLMDQQMGLVKRDIDSAMAEVNQILNQNQKGN